MLELLGEFLDLIDILLEEEGEDAASILLRQIGSKAEETRGLLYRLFTVCERKGWAEEAFAYNGLVMAWPEIEKLATQKASDVGIATQGELDL